MPDLQLMLFDLTAQMFNVVATVAVPVLTALSIRWLNAKFRLNIKEQQQRQLETLGVQAVMTASQKLSDMAGAREEINRAKKQGAVAQLVRDAARIGVRLTADVAGDVIEAQVNRLKRERNAR